jgi:hypothetical protein
MDGKISDITELSCAFVTFIDDDLQMRRGKTSQRLMMNSTIVCWVGTVFFPRTMPHDQLRPKERRKFSHVAQNSLKASKMFQNLDFITA